MQKQEMSLVFNFLIPYLKVLIKIKLLQVNLSLNPDCYIF